MWSSLETGPKMCSTSAETSPGLALCQHRGSDRRPSSPLPQSSLAHEEKKRGLDVLLLATLFCRQAGWLAERLGFWFLPQPLNAVGPGYFEKATLSFVTWYASSTGSRDPRRCVLTVPYFPKYLGSLAFPTPNPTSIKCSSFHGPDVSPGVAVGGCRHMSSGGISSAGQVALGYQAGRGCGCWWCLGYLPWMAPGLSAIQLGKVPSPLHSRGEVGVPETPAHGAPQGNCQRDRQSGYLKSCFLAGEEQEGICKLRVSVLNDKILSQTLQSAAWAFTIPEKRCQSPAPPRATHALSTRKCCSQKMSLVWSVLLPLKWVMS